MLRSSNPLCTKLYGVHLIFTTLAKKKGTEEGLINPVEVWDWNSSPCAYKLDWDWMESSNLHSIKATRWRTIVEVVVIQVGGVIYQVDDVTILAEEVVAIKFLGLLPKAHWPFFGV